MAARQGRFDLSEPTLLLGFGDPGDEVVADLGKPCPFGGVGSEGRASDASMHRGCKEIRRRVRRYRRMPSAFRSGPGTGPTLRRWLPGIPLQVVETGDGRRRRDGPRSLRADRTIMVESGIGTLRMPRPKDCGIRSERVEEASPSCRGMLGRVVGDEATNAEQVTSKRMSSGGPILALPHRFATSSQTRVASDFGRTTGTLRMSAGETGPRSPIVVVAQGLRPSVTGLRTRPEALRRSPSPTGLCFAACRCPREQDAVALLSRRWSVTSREAARGFDARPLRPMSDMFTRQVSLG